jgi:hypothetical protein
MTNKRTKTWRPNALIPAIVVVLLIGGAPQAYAQGAGPGATGGQAQQPSAAPNQPPPASGAENRPATPPGGGTVGMGGSRIPGHTGQVSTVEVKPDPIVEESEKEVSRRIRSICRGC